MAFKNVEMDGIFLLLKIFRSRQKKKSTTIDAHILTDLLYEIAEYWRKIYWIEFSHRRKKRRPIHRFLFFWYNVKSERWHKTWWTWYWKMAHIDLSTLKCSIITFNFFLFFQSNNHFCHFPPPYLSHTLSLLQCSMFGERVRTGKQ